MKKTKRKQAPTKLAGIVGWPVSHSMSPLLHGWWLAQSGINGAYVPLAVKREDFGRVIEALMLAGFTGVNVTVPHKEAAFALAHRRDRTSERAGAANLLLFRSNGHIEARNTDVDGLKASLKEELAAGAVRGQSVVVLGAGGAARAAILALDALGARRIAVLNRTPSRAGGMAAALAGAVRAEVSVHPLSEWSRLAGTSSLLVNATSAGMKGHDELALSLDLLPKKAAVCDLVYNPVETKLLRQARRRGLKTVTGLSMLIHQAVPSFEAFFGSRPKPTPALKRRLQKVLDAAT